MQLIFVSLKWQFTTRFWQYPWIAIELSTSSDAYACAWALSMCHRNNEAKIEWKNIIIVISVPFGNHFSLGRHEKFNVEEKSWVCCWHSHFIQSDFPISEACTNIRMSWRVREILSPIRISRVATRNRKKTLCEFAVRWFREKFYRQPVPTRLHTALRCWYEKDFVRRHFCDRDDDCIVDVETPAKCSMPVAGNANTSNALRTRICIFWWETSWNSELI